MQKKIACIALLLFVFSTYSLTATAQAQKDIPTYDEMTKEQLIPTQENSCNFATPHHRLQSLALSQLHSASARSQKFQKFSWVGIIQELKQTNAVLRAKSASLNFQPSKVIQDYEQYYYGDFARQKNAAYLKTYTLQGKATEIFLWMVVIIVLSGVFFSGLQLAVEAGLLAKTPTPDGTKNIP